MYKITIFVFLMEIFMQEMIGMVFGRLTVTALNSKRRNKVYFWLCKCECGKTPIISGEHLRRGHTRSCGCLQKEQVSKMFYKHGKSKLREYRILHQAKSRCYNKSNKHYHNYGGRGIRICERWLDVKNGCTNFIQDMGSRPSNKHSLDRIDVNGNYEPGNCRWATKLEQESNKRTNIHITYRGETKIAAEWCRIFNIPTNTLCYRMKKGWDTEKLLSKPDKSRKRPKI